MASDSESDSDIEILSDDESESLIYMFYKNTIKSKPRGDYIDVIHNEWNFDILESHHGFIQWLFPLRERGLNFQAPILRNKDIELIKNDNECMDRFIKSYDMMLSFYGLRRADDSGTIIKKVNWKKRYRNLKTSTHNFLRITRILKCLGEFGFEEWKIKLIDHFIKEVGNKKISAYYSLKCCKRSLEDFWIETIKSEKLRNNRLDMLRVYTKKNQEE